MKTLRLAIISLVVVASASASFAGSGIQQLNRRPADRAASKAAVTAPASTSEKCDTMIVKQGKRTSTVKCEGAVRDTAKCKAACGS